MRGTLALACVALLLVAVGCGSDDSAGESSGESAAAVIDEYLAAWSSDDPDGVVGMFADEFYFKGLGPYESERLDAEALRSYAEAMVPLRIRMERSGDIATDEAGRASFEAVIISDELDGRLASMEAEVKDGLITYMVTLDWEKTG